MSKFERHGKKTEQYVYPHKHCKKCGQMIEEAHNFCSECHKIEKARKEKKRFKKKKAPEEPKEEIPEKEEETNQ